MSLSKLNRSHYRINGNFGKCLVCPDAKWVESITLRKHNISDKHKEKAKKWDRQEQEAEGSEPARRTTSQRSETDNPTWTADVDGFEQTLLPGDDTAYFPSTIPVDWQNPDTRPRFYPDPYTADGQPFEFSAGASEPDIFAESLHRVLTGLAPVWSDRDGEEAPGWDDSERKDDDGEAEDSDSEPGGDDLSPQEIAEIFFDGAADDSYFPYPSETMMRLDLLFNSPRLRYSRRAKSALLDFARASGAHGVPTLSTYESWAKGMLNATGDPSVKYESTNGHVYYINRPVDSIAKDMANPLVRPKMQFYPEDAGSRSSEVWHGKKWLRDVDANVPTPMVRVGTVDYFVNELVYCQGKEWFIPERFFQKGGVLWARGLDVTNTDRGLVVDLKTEFTREVSSFRKNWPQISDENAEHRIFAEESMSFAANMPNPDRAIAAGREILCPPMICFADDVSGNISKQYNKHLNFYFVNAALPRTEVDKEYNVKFIATSSHAPVMEIYQGVCQSLKALIGSGVEAFDCMSNQTVLLRPWVLFSAGDNPMQAEECSGIGNGGNKFCRVCDVGGTQKFKQSDEGFASLLKPGTTRKTSDTLNEIYTHIEMAKEPASTDPLKDQMRLTGIKDPIATPIINNIQRMGIVMRKRVRGGFDEGKVRAALDEELNKFSDKEIVNPLLLMRELDIHEDTPVEILHTVLLGVVKYYWGQTMWHLDHDHTLPTFQARLNSLNESGLNIPNILADYMIQYKGGLNGKHFKTLAQVMVFAVPGLVPADILNAWKALGRLCTLLWRTEIENLDAYLIQLKGAIDDLMDITVSCSPSILLLKAKFHFLLHLPENIRRFGPAIMFSTERFESFNSVFRECSIHSNRQAPSRDIAHTFAHLDRVKHILSGGYWYDASQRMWVCASRKVIEQVSSQPNLAHLLGLPKPATHVPGDVQLLPFTRKPRKRPPPIEWKDSIASVHSSEHVGQNIEPKSLWDCGRAVFARNNDKAKIGDHVIVQRESDAHRSLVFARVEEILVDADTRSGSLLATTLQKVQVTVALSGLDEKLDKHIGMPTLLVSRVFTVLPPEDILCVVNVQHNCYRLPNLCPATAQQVEVQERANTTRSRWVIGHADDDRFIINMHALHNAQIIYDALPADLKPKGLPSVGNRKLYHHAAAQKMRKTKEDQRAAGGESGSKADMANRKKADTLQSKPSRTTSGPSATTGGGSESHGGSDVAESSGAESENDVRLARMPRQQAAATAARNSRTRKTPIPKPTTSGDRISALARSEDGSGSRPKPASPAGNPSESTQAQAQPANFIHYDPGVLDYSNARASSSKRKRRDSSYFDDIG